MTQIFPMQFGNWTATEKKVRNNGNPHENRTYFVCRCICGMIEEVAVSTLRAGTSKQCRDCRSKGNKAQFCINGHDTLVSGRNARGMCLICFSASRKSEITKTSTRKRLLWRLYRLTPEEWAQIKKFQGDVCAITGTPPGTRPLSTDHNHKSGQIRGLLSVNANKGLAYFNDDPALLRKAAEYLENPPATQALGRAVYGLIGKAKAYKKKMVYGSANGPLPILKKGK